MNRTTVVVGGAVALLAVGIAAALLHKSESVIYLRVNAQGACAAIDPGLMSAAWKHKVTWTVINESCDDQYISIRNFRPRNGDQLGDLTDLVDDPSQLNYGPLARGNSRDLTSRINKFHLYKRYKYEVWIGPSAGGVTVSLDPDIDVWPF
jgi:hypothetical protein